MIEYYNLLDIFWLLVCLVNGEVCEMGLLEVFCEVGCISVLVEIELFSVIVQYCLLLVIIYWVFLLEYGVWKDSGRLCWFCEGLFIDVVECYLECW